MKARNLQKYLLIFLLVGVWNCPESHLLNYEIQLLENNSEDTPLIILMHGYGNNAKSYSQKGDFSIGINVIYLDAPYAMIPLLGKNIQSTLMKKIVTSTIKKIYIALDKDAQKQSLDFCKKFIDEGKEVYLVELDDKDPSEMGFSQFTNLIQQTFPLTYSDLMEKKIMLS